ncbi:MAG: hypothetical protein M0014_16145 [Actinomycetota bacterium]|jgi:hypothetical protein|nr:hypothetical protein [Actinomycetota bacterium]
MKWRRLLLIKVWGAALDTAEWLTAIAARRLAVALRAAVHHGDLELP